MKRIKNPPANEQPEKIETVNRLNDHSESLFKRMVELMVWSHVDLHYLNLTAKGEVDHEPGRPAVIVARFKETASILTSIVHFIENSPDYQKDFFDATPAKIECKGANCETH